jgi:hypothetical protein
MPGNPGQVYGENKATPSEHKKPDGRNDFGAMEYTHVFYRTKYLLKINELQRCDEKNNPKSLARKGGRAYLCAPQGKPGGLPGWRQ